MFTRVAKIAIQSDIGAFVINPEHGNYLKDKFGITFNHWLQLSELGLISSQDLVRTHRESDLETETGYICDDIIILLTKPPGEPEFRFPIKRFTSIGSELVSLVNKEMAQEYIKKFAGMLKQHNTRVRYGKIIEILPNKSVRYNDVEDFNFGADDSEPQ